MAVTQEQAELFLGAAMAIKTDLGEVSPDLLKKAVIIGAEMISELNDAFDALEAKTMTIEKYEESEGYDLCPYANSMVHADASPDNFSSTTYVTLGRAIDVMKKINPEAIRSMEGDSDDWFIYVHQDKPLFK